MTFRLYARTEDEATAMVDDDPVLDMDTPPTGGMLPFLSDSPTVHCLNCSRLFTPDGYVAHPCCPDVPSDPFYFRFPLDDDDEETGIEYEVEIPNLWIVVVVVATVAAIAVDSIFGIAAWLRK